MSVLLTAGKGASKRITKKPVENQNKPKHKRTTNVPNPFFGLVPNIMRSKYINIDMFDIVHTCDIIYIYIYIYIYI